MARWAVIYVAPWPASRATSDGAAYPRRYSRPASTQWGWFDPTIRPVLQLWWQCSTEQRWPQAVELEHQLSYVGLEKLHVLADGRWQAQPGLMVDFGAVRKGSCVDRMIEQCDDQQVAALVHHGSSIWRASSCKPPAPWRITLPEVFAQTNNVITLPPGKSLAISDSGGQVFQIAGQRVGHLINPHTGETVPLGRSAVVIADNAFIADALATIACMAPVSMCQSVFDYYQASGIMHREGQNISLGTWD